MNCEEKKIFERIAGNLGDISLWLLILCMTQCAQCARAETISVTLFRVHSPQALNDWQYETVIARVRTQYRRDMNVGLRIRQKHVWDQKKATSYVWDVERDLEAKALTNEFWKWILWGDEKRLSRKRSYGWIVEGATSPRGYRYSWGKAFQGCSKQMPRYFVATGIYNNGLGANRLDYSAKTIAHELGHTVGAGHVGDRSLMNTNMGSFYEQDAYIPFSPFSVEQIKKCLKS